MNIRVEVTYFLVTAFAFSLMACNTIPIDKPSSTISPTISTTQSELTQISPSGRPGKTAPVAEAVLVQINPVSCAAQNVGISEQWIKTLEEANFTKCVRPFGVLIGADQRVPNIYIAQAARIVAEILDPDMDGVANDPKVAALVADYETAWIPMPTDIDSWQDGNIEHKLGAQLGSYGIALPRWWMLGDNDFGDSEPDTHARAVMVEEIVHFLTQFGYSPAYPQIFGVNNWNSLIAKEAKLASCDWWQHPENDCPGRLGYTGDCSEPNCDVVEFYHQVLVTQAGMEPGWLGIGFPTTWEILEAKLSPALKEAMQHPEHHQINEPLSFSYPLKAH